MYVMIKANIGQFCGLVEIIVGDWIIIIIFILSPISNVYKDTSSVDL